MRKSLAAVLRALAARLEPSVPFLDRTQFAGSGLSIQIYGAADLITPTSMSAVESANVAGGGA